MIIIVDNGIKKFHEATRHLEGLDGLKFIYLDSEEITNNLIKDAEILFVRATTKVNERLLKNTRIKLVGSATAGSDHLNTKYLDEQKIKWFYSPGCNSSSVVHYVLSSVAFLVDNNLFSKDDSVGIFGCGHVGSKLRHALNALQITNYAYDPFLNMNFLTSIEKVKNCKLVSMHVPLTDIGKFPTRNIINDDFLKDFKGKILINSSRGEIIDERALLESNELLFIGDVWNNEPSPSKKVIDFSLISTPHIAGHSCEGKINGTVQLFYQLFKYLNLTAVKETSNKVILNDYFAINSIEDYPKELRNYKDSFNIFRESEKFKKACQGFQEDIPARIFKKSRSGHVKRTDITP